MNQQKPNSWEELQIRRTKLRKEVQLKEESINRKCNRLFDAPPVENKLDLYFNYAKTAFNAYDGFMTGFKLLKNWKLLLKKIKTK